MPAEMDERIRELTRQLKDVEHRGGPRGIGPPRHPQSRHMTFARAYPWEVIRRLGADHVAWILLSSNHPAITARSRARGMWDANELESESAYRRLADLIESGEISAARPTTVPTSARQTSAELEREVQAALAQPEDAQGALATGMTLRLGRQSYVVEKVGAHSAELRGARGGKYALVQNRQTPGLWSLVTAGRTTPSSTWFHRTPDGSFLPANER